MNYLYNEILHSSDDSYNKNLYLRESHNCYTYFLNLKSNYAFNVCKGKYHKKKRCDRPQPGYASNHRKMIDEDYNCNEIMKRTLDDNKKIFKTKLDIPCPKNYYKGAMVVAPKNDFHYYRLNDDGLWTHKPGYKPSTHLDADNKIIENPEKANRNYGSLNYKDFCGYLCIPRGIKNKTMKMYSQNNRYTRKI